jgi:hypothetical protein
MSQIDVTDSPFSSNVFPRVSNLAGNCRHPEGRNLWSNQRRILHIQDIFGAWFRAAGHG